MPRDRSPESETITAAAAMLAANNAAIVQARGGLPRHGVQRVVAPAADTHDRAQKMKSSTPTTTSNPIRKITPATQSSTFVK